MTVFRRLGLALFGIIAMSTAASAQSSPTCVDFEREPNGSWRPLRQITVSNQTGAKVTIGPGMEFRPGVAFAGLDLGVALEQQCRH
jgi:hypothetical protein